MRLLRLSLLPVALLASIASAVTHYDVTVGKGGLKFDPEVIPTANHGDTITYHFFAKNHSVTQSTFDDPCHFLPGGIFSAFVPTTANDTASATTFTITISDTKPLWFYCGQGDHCQKGMVHSINAPTTGNTHDSFKAKAATAKASTSPIEGPDGGIPIGGVREVSVDVAPGGELKFVPNNINEPPGTTVKFSFNPANHSVVQSSFDKPCQPLANGFTSGFIPTQARPSGVTFHVEIKDTKPIWFYCAQTTKTHCQAGMVGSFNAPKQGNTLEAFVAAAAQAPPSTIPPTAPIGGVIIANGTQVGSFGGAVFNPQTADKDVIKHIPLPGENVTESVWHLAGGGQPSSYNWPPAISNELTELLQLSVRVDNLILEALWDGFDKLKRGGAWAGMYPHSIVSTIGSLAAQQLVHRSTATDSLQHYQKPLGGSCTFSYPSANLDAWLSAVVTLLGVKNAVHVDVISITAASDPWVVPALASQLGATARMAAVLNMMQNHKAAASPRDALLPSKLGYSYVMANYVTGCEQAALDGPVVGKQKVLPKLVFTDKKHLGSLDSVTAVTLAIPSDAPAGGLWIAWIGAWGSLRFTEVRRTDGFATVPADMFGHLWAVLVTATDVKLQEVAGVAIAGPEPIWVQDPTWDE